MAAVERALTATTTKTVSACFPGYAGRTVDVASAAEAPHTAVAQPASAPKGSCCRIIRPIPMPAHTVSAMEPITSAAVAGPSATISAIAIRTPRRATAMRRIRLMQRVMPGAKTGCAARRLKAIPSRRAITMAGSVNGRAAMKVRRRPSGASATSATTATMADSATPGTCARAPATACRTVPSTKDTSSAAVKLGHHELAVAQRLGGGEASIGRAHDHVDQRVAGVVERHLAPQDAGHVEIDVLGHGADGARIAADLDHRQDRVADDVALAGGERVHDVTGGGHQRDALGRGRRGVHIIEARALGRRLG